MTKDPTNRCDVNYVGYSSKSIHSYEHCRVQSLNQEQQTLKYAEVSKKVALNIPGFTLNSVRTNLSTCVKCKIYRNSVTVITLQYLALEL
jgi:hypothetical protein